MKHGLVMVGLFALALAGCDRGSEPSAKVQGQTAQKDQQGAPSPVGLWSQEFKEQTLKECIQSATREMNTDGVRRCKCVVEKASTTITEQRFKTIGTDPEVKAQLKQIGAAC
jgi:hypothetical protein